MKRVSLRPFKVPPRHQHTLPNGLTVHVVPRGQLPLVAARMVIHSGDVSDEPGHLGVADFAARLMRRGAAGKTADVLSEEIEFLGASLGGCAEEERTIMSLSAATKHLPAALELMSQVLLEPEFPHAEIELARRRSLAQLVNAFDDPSALADRALARACWGSHPYGHATHSGRADLEAITREDLLRFQRERLGPRIAHLFVVGDAEVDQVLSLTQRCFGRWQGGPEANRVTPQWPGLTRAGEVIIVDKPEQSQVQLRIGAKGTRRGHADLYPVTVMNGILGGGFTSRLMTEIRVKRGLSYGVSSTFENLGVAGLFEIATFTKTENVNSLIDVTLGQVSKLKHKGASPKEVETVKRYIAGLFPSRLETNESLAGVLADIQTYGLAPGWVEQYREHIHGVTVKQVNEAAQKYLFSDERVMVLVGHANELEQRVAQYGRVSVIKPKDLE